MQTQTINAIFWLENGKNGCAVLDYMTTIQYIIKRCPKNTSWAPRRFTMPISKQDMTCHTASFISDWLSPASPVKYLYIVDEICENQPFDIELNCVKNKEEYFSGFKEFFDDKDFIDFSYLSEYDPKEYDYDWPKVDLRLLEERQEMTDYTDEEENHDKEDEDEEDEENKEEEIIEYRESKEEKALINMLGYQMPEWARTLVMTRYSQLFCKEFTIMFIECKEERVNPTYTIETTTVHLQKKLESSKVYVLRCGMRHVRAYVNDGHDYYGSHSHYDRTYIKNGFLDKKMRSVMENILENSLN